MSSTSEVDAESQSLGIRVARTVNAPVAAVWQAMISAAGAQALLGPGASLGSKGETWHSDDGPSGVLRSFHPQEQLRLSWHDTPDAPASLVELDLAEDDGATRIDLRHDRISGDTAAHEQRWNDALDRLSAVLPA